MDTITQAEYDEILEATRAETRRHNEVVREYRAGEVDDDTFLDSLGRMKAQEQIFDAAFDAELVEETGDVQNLPEQMTLVEIDGEPEPEPDLAHADMGAWEESHPAGDAWLA